MCLKVVEPNREVRPSSARFTPGISPDACIKFGVAYDQMKAVGQQGRPSLLDRQAGLHAWSCDVDNIHDSLFFLLWHRGFIYFHERMLRRFSGDDNLRLPYWDWSAPSCENFYKPGTPLARPENPEPFSIAHQSILAQSLASAQSLLTINDFKTFQQDFRGPHGSVHNQSRGVMPNLRWAAWDPLFYGHHGNCDRFLAGWQKAHAPTFQDLKLTESDTALMKSSWLYFFNEDGNLVKLRPKDLWNIDSLGYSYEDPVEPAEIHTDPSNGPGIAIESPLADTTLDSLRGGQAIWADLAPLAEGTKASISRLAFILRSKEDGLPESIEKLYADPRFLGQFTQVPKRDKGDNEHVHPPNISWTVDASRTLRHFVKSSKPREKVWLATVDVDQSGKLAKPKLVKAKTNLGLRYYKVEPRRSRPR